MHVKANEIVELANELVDVRYRHQGRSMDSLDCAGVLVFIAKTLGLSDFDYRNYSNRPDPSAFTEALMQGKCKQLPLTQLANGDIIRFAMEGWPVHVAVYEIDDHGREWFIHAYMLHRKVTRDPLTPDVRKRISSVWRFPE